MLPAAMDVPDSLRQRLTDYHLGAPVYSSEGAHIGSLRRVVVDGEGWDPHQIVVKESVRFNGHYLAVAAGLMTDELVVPVSAVGRISHDRVDLTLTSREVRRLPPYLTHRWAPLSATDAAIGDLGILVGAPRPPGEVEEAAKAPGDIEIRLDESVMLGHEGHILGRVRDVLVDEGEMVGVVVHPEDGPEQDVVVQVRFLERGDDGALFVRMTAEDREQLPPFRPEAG